MLKIRSVAFYWVVLLLISGCGTIPVADDIGQKEANDIVVLLRDSGISSTLVKSRGGKGRYSVTVPEGRFADAAAVLSKFGLPADRKASFQELTATSGIIPSSRELESLRLDRADATEIEDLLKTRSDITGVSALVRVRSLKSGEMPSAAVVIQTRAGSNLSEGIIREIVTRAVPGIQPQSVTVSITQSARPGVVATDSDSTAGDDAMVPFLGAWRVPASEYSSLVLVFIGLSVFVGTLSGLSGYLVGQFNWLRRQVGSSAPKPIRQVERTVASGRAEEVSDESRGGGGR
jgi:type III secretory pathway lipoprotein EscJ